MVWGGSLTSTPAVRPAKIYLARPLPVPVQMTFYTGSLVYPTQGAVIGQGASVEDIILSSTLAPKGQTTSAGTELQLYVPYGLFNQMLPNPSYFRYILSKAEHFVCPHSYMLCYVMLCYVMLCYVMLCYVMLCYVMSFIVCILFRATQLSR